MNLNSLIDFANQATNQIAKFQFTATLSPETLMTEGYGIAALHWSSISYGEAGLTQVPDDKRGIYAFAICHNSNVLPPHGYILYIGIAGRDSTRSLRERYKDYLNEKSVIKRSKIARMIGTWHEVLQFFFAPVDDDFSSDDLKSLEQQLNTALMPPFSVADIDANTRRQRRAFP